MALEEPATTYEDYMFVFMHEIRNYQKVGIFQEQGHNFAGRHLLTCEMFHKPEDCNYSHIEILIHHRVYKDGEKTPFFDKVYTYEDWQNSTAELRKSNGKFFKAFRKQFRLDMIKLFSRKSDSNMLWNDMLALCKCIKLNTIDQTFVLKSA